MKTIKYIAPLLLLSLIFSCNNKTVKQENNKYQEFIDTLRNYQANVKLIDSLDWRDTVFYKFDTTTFNLNKYFSIFNKLQIKSGWKIDYYFIWNGMGGAPFIFVLKENETIDSILLNFNHSEFKKSFPLSSFLYLYNDSVNIIDFIKLNETNESYFQLLMFYELGCNFNLVWHTNYNAHEIICSKNAMKELIANNKNKEFNDIYLKIENSIDSINFPPKIKFGKDSVNMKVIVFTQGKGLCENYYSIARKFPHKIKKIKTNIIINNKTKIIF